MIQPPYRSVHSGVSCGDYVLVIYPYDPELFGTVHKVIGLDADQDFLLTDHKGALSKWVLPSSYVRVGGMPTEEQVQALLNLLNIKRPT